MRNKRKSIILAASILGTLAVASTGFAAFVITGDHVATTNGSITVDTVENEAHSITNATITENLVFGPVSSLDSDANKGWMAYRNDGKDEHLSIKITLTCSNSNTLDSTKPFEVQFTGDAKWTAAVTANLVQNWDGTFTATRTETTNNWTIEITGFKWGSEFGNKNPMNYYNSQDYSDALAADADTKINGTEFTGLGEATYTVTITPKTKTN